MTEPQTAAEIRKHLIRLYDEKFSAKISDMWEEYLRVCREVERWEARLSQVESK